jgi:hypothetical protein
MKEESCVSRNFTSPYLYHIHPLFLPPYHTHPLRQPTTRLLSCSSTPPLSLPKCFTTTYDPRAIHLYFSSQSQYSLRVSRIHLKVVRLHHRHAKCGVNKAPLGTSLLVHCLVCISAELAAALPTSSPTFLKLHRYLVVKHALFLYALEPRKAI